MKKKKERKYFRKLNTFHPADFLLNQKDPRHKMWKKQRAKYGFDEREIWSLDDTMVCLLYERIMFFNQFCKSDIQSDTHKKANSRLLKLLKEYFTTSMGVQERERITEEIWLLWADINGYYWT